MKRGLVTGGSGKGELADFFQDFKYVLNVSRKEQDKQKWLKMTETDREKTGIKVLEDMGRN